MSDVAQPIDVPRANLEEALTRIGSVADSIREHGPFEALEMGEAYSWLRAHELNPIATFVVAGHLMAAIAEVVENHVDGIDYGTFIRLVSDEVARNLFRD